MADPLSLQDARSLGWATEESLKSLLSNSNITNATLRLIGERYKGFGTKLDSRLAELGVVIKKTAESPAPDSPGQKTNNARLTQLNSSLQSVNRGIGHFSGMFNARDASSMIGGLAYGLKGLATDAQYYGGALSKFIPQLSVASDLLKVFNTVLGEITKVAGSMREMYAGGIGVATSLAGLTQAASDSGMQVTEFASLLAKHGRVAATLGTRATMDLSRQFQRMTGFGGQLMMGQKAAGEAFFETLEMMRNSGEMQGLSQQQIARRGVNLLQNFNDLAVATGRNRDELRKQTADIMRQPLVNLWSRMLPEEGRRRLADMTARLAAEFGDQGATIANMIERVGQAGGGFGLMEEQFRPLISVVPGFGRALQNAARGVRDGSITQEQAVRGLSDSFAGMSNQQLTMISRANPQLAGFVSQMLQARQAAEDSRKQIEREAAERGISVQELMDTRRRQTERMQQIQTSLNTAGASATRFGQSFTKIAASLSGVITPILDGFSYALDIVSSMFETLADVIEPFADIIGRVTSIIGRLVGGVLNTVGNIVGKLWRETGLASLFSIVGGGIGSMVDKMDDIIDGIDEFFENISTGFSNVFDYLKNKMDRALGWFGFGRGSSADPKEAGDTSPTVGGFTVAVATLLAGGVLYKIAGTTLRWLAGAGAGLFTKTIGLVGKIPGVGALGRGASAGASAGMGAAGRAGGMLGGIGRSMAGFAAGTGRVVSSALRGLATGITALGRPAVLRGLLTMTAMVAPLYLSAKAFQEFNTVDWGSMLKAGVALGAMGGALALVGRMIGQTEVRGALMFSVAIGAMGLGMLAAGEGLKAFNDVNWESMIKAGVAIAALAGAALLIGSGPQAAALAVGGAAIGSAIGLIGAGIAGASWLVGNTLPTLIEGLKGFENLDGSKLGEAALGMTAISGALVLMTGGSIVSGLGGLVSSFANLFTEDPVSKLKRFAEIGPPLRVAAESMRVFSEVMPSAVDALNRINISRNAVDALDRFKEMFGSGWFSSRISASDLNSGIFLIFAKFAEQRTTIESAVEAINRLTQIDLSGMTKLRDLLMISSSIGPRSISNLSALVSNPQFVQGLQGLMSAVQTATPAAAPVSAGAGAGGGTMTIDQLNLETLQYYNVTKVRFTEMVDTLKLMLDTLNATKDNNSRGFNAVVDAVRPGR